MEIEVSEGFKKCHSKNIPTISSDLLFSYISEKFKNGAKNVFENNQATEAVIDYVQLKRNDNCIIKCYVYDIKDSVIKFDKPNEVSIVFNENNKKIQFGKCETCNSEQPSPCKHVIQFLFWIHRNSFLDEFKIFWNIIEKEKLDPESIKLKNILPSQIDNNQTPELSPDEDENLLYLILDEMEKNGLNNSLLYTHFRPVIDEFEPLYIHHTMLDHVTNSIKDFQTFNIYMEEIAARGLFSKLTETSPDNYKSKMWYEAQFGRIRCSLMFSVLNRQYGQEDDALLDSVFCLNREDKAEYRKTLKDHKRFILKQTQKLENKEYQECGILLNETYPFICASPDGIADDHIVEIKVPKTNEEFEKYLIGKETIAPKYMAQMQLCMYLANVQKALFCVLSPKFDDNGAMHYVWVQAELQQIANLLSAAEDYWKEIVFPKLKKVYLNR